MERSGNPPGTVDHADYSRALADAGVELDDIGVLHIRGTDAEAFLQGQLSNDVMRLAREGSLLAGFHNPQGRVIALLRLVHAAEHDIFAVLPRELTGLVAQRLGRFILRSKVQISDDSAAWHVRGFVRTDPPRGLAFKLPGEPVRSIALVPAPAEPLREARPAASASTDAPTPASAPRNLWRLLDIAAGLPQIHAQTSELFVAQMLNMDLIDAISFSKGCYTGQEVIARAHYRGRVKRRMQRWRTIAPAALAPGATAQLADGRTLRIVDAAQRLDGGCEFLAVAPLAAGADEEAAAPADRNLLEAIELPLPYELPAT